MNESIAMKVVKAQNFESNAECKKFYDEMGYVSIKGCIPIEIIKKIQVELTQFIRNCSDAPGLTFTEACLKLNQENKTLLYELYKAGANLAAFKEVSIFLAKAVKQINNQDTPVLESNIAYLLGLPKDGRLVYDFHQEASYDSAEIKKFDNIMNVHYPIFQTSDLGNGTMSALASSHKLGLLEGNVVKSASNGLSSLVPKNIEEICRTHEEVHYELELGDCLLFHKNLIHKSNYNSSDNCRAIGTSRVYQAFSADFKSL
jgi:ectoine hydroxylase-related dioxygenase (phytanoyl-CoA dioxygenase family)